MICCSAMLLNWIKVNRSLPSVVHHCPCLSLLKIISMGSAKLKGETMLLLFAYKSVTVISPYVTDKCVEKFLNSHLGNTQFSFSIARNPTIYASGMDLISLALVVFSRDTSTFDSS